MDPKRSVKFSVSFKEWGCGGVCGEKRKERRLEVASFVEEYSIHLSEEASLFPSVRVKKVKM